MPELPEVETVRLGLAPVMEGAAIDKVTLHRPDLRAPFPPKFARRLTGRRILSLGRRAKYLLADLDDGNVLVMHLGMSGSFRIEWEDGHKIAGRYYHPRSTLRAHDHVVFDLSSGARVIFNDPRRFGMMDLIPRSGLEESRHFKGLGIEPLGNELSGEKIAALFEGRTAPLKAVLLDQRRIAGIGNIYACEAMWQARLAPVTPAGRLSKRDKTARARAAALAAALRDVLRRAVAAGGSSLRDHRQATGELGSFQHHFAVYDREGEPCPRPTCNGVIRRMVQSGRSTFYCPVCQG